MATKKNTGGDDTVDHSKSVDDHSEDVTVEHWDHPKSHSGTYRIDRGDRVIKYARPSSVDESG